MVAEGEFMDGPMHGEVLAFPGDEPPPMVVLEMSPVIRESIEAEQERLMTYQYVYVREISQLDDGPMWVYVPLSSQPDDDD